MAFASLKKYLGGGKTPPQKPRARPAAAVRPGDLAHLLATMGRLLSGLDRQPALANQKLTTRDWIALTMLAEARKLTNKQLAKLLGVTGLAVREIIASLRGAGMVAYTAPSAEGIRFIELTEAGAASLASANAEIHPRLVTVLKGREQMLVGVTKQLRLLTRVTK